jgi:transposase
VLADLAKSRLRAKLAALREALEGRVDHLHAVWIGAILAHIDVRDEQIASLTETIEEQIAPAETAVELLCSIFRSSTAALPSASSRRSAST